LHPIRADPFPLCKKANFGLFLLYVNGTKVVLGLANGKRSRPPKEIGEAINYCAMAAEAVSELIFQSSRNPLPIRAVVHFGERPCEFALQCQLESQCL
jgi:hypothetical protein